MALVKLINEMYDTERVSRSRTVQNPAKQIMDALRDYAYFTEIYRELAEDPKNGEQDYDIFAVQNLDLIKGRWEGEIPCIPGCKISISQTNEVGGRLRYALVGIKYLPGADEKDLQQVRDVIEKAQLDAWDSNPAKQR